MVEPVAAAPTRESASLLLMRDGQPLLRIALVGRGIRIGAHARNDLALAASGLPDFLGEVRLTPTGQHVAQACPGQTLTINGTPTRQHTLRDGDRIELGSLCASYTEPLRQNARAPTGSTGQITISQDGRTLEIAAGLLIYRAEGKRKAVTVAAGGVRVGKNPENDLVLNDRSVSGFHAVVYARAGRYFVRDLESTNGTVVNNLKIVEGELPFGADIRFGRAEVRFERQVTEAPLTDEPRQALDDMISCDPRMHRLFNLIERVAPFDATVCINGETGTGKELVARALHRHSPRSDQPFIAINVAAIPQELIEDELFGHEKGAFTGADRQHAGAFEQAQRGTLFLDEIGELPLTAQAKLLRVLESRQLRRVGGREIVELDVRIVCATHQDLPLLVKQGRFREDLLHRVFVLPIQLPPLRQRRGDVELLARHFLASSDPSGRTRTLSSEALRRLLEHPWPGNVRELRNVLVRAAVLCERDPIDADSIVFATVGLEERVAEQQAFAPQLRLDVIERRTILEALDQVNGNRSHAAELLGISRSTLIRKIRDYQLGGDEE
ncbi:MAG: sigma 54-interacting transcriptional regulator [Deltaproteobacteria bacterium]|nr:sigma 54-interacting transcriptional regulator [Deltaproteobacteria bacterium]